MPDKSKDDKKEVTRNEPNQDVIAPSNVIVTAGEDHSGSKTATGQSGKE